MDPLWAVTEVSNARQLEVDVSSRRVFDPCWDVKGTEDATEGETERGQSFHVGSWTAGTVGGTIVGSFLADAQSVALNADSDDLFEKYSTIISLHVRGSLLSGVRSCEVRSRSFVTHLPP